MHLRLWLRLRLFSLAPSARPTATARLSSTTGDGATCINRAYKAAMAGQLGPEKIENVVGRAEIREVFQAGKHGKAAGLLVLEGVIRKALKARVMRDDVIIYNGAVASLRRFKDDVAEVRAGLECGVVLEDTNDIKPGDNLEVFSVEERERTL